MSADIPEDEPEAPTSVPASVPLSPPVPVRGRPAHTADVEYR